jgi:magnesium chelatase accessory protein
MHGMARGVARLLEALQLQPAWVVGHSAGAAIAVRMALSAAIAPRALLAFNAALFPLPGLAGSLFSPAAKLLALSPWVPHLFAWRAQRRAVLHKLLQSTGSHIDDEGSALYRQLVTHPGHVAGALAMVARWDLPALAADLPRLRTPLHLLVGENDGTVPPADARRAQALVPGATLTPLPGLGHLAHEERPDVVAAVIERMASSA